MIGSPRISRVFVARRIFGALATGYSLPTASVSGAALRLFGSSSGARLKLILGSVDRHERWFSKYSTKFFLYLVSGEISFMIKSTVSTSITLVFLTDGLLL